MLACVYNLCVGGARFVTGYVGERRGWSNMKMM